MFAGCAPEELDDPHSPPEGVEGPFTIAGQNLLSIHAFRLIVCQEIVKNQEHPRLDLFYEFEMTIYCFPNPDDPAQVFNMLFTYCCVGWTHTTTRNRL